MEQTKRVIMTGGTGMIGGIVLRECLENEAIGHVTSIVRRPSGVEHPKLTEVIQDDFLNYQGVTDHFQNQDIAFYCLGVYTGQVPRAQFREITVDYTVAFAEALKQESPEVTFCFLSGAGADQTEKSRVAFAKDKGVAENFLLRQDFGQTYLFRPAYIYPVVARKEPNFSYQIMRFLYPLFKSIYPNGVITSEQLGAAMFKAGFQGAPKRVLENVEIKAL